MDIQNDIQTLASKLNYKGIRISLAPDKDFTVQEAMEDVHAFLQYVEDGGLDEATITESSKQYL